MNMKALLAGFAASVFFLADGNAAVPVEVIREFNLALESGDQADVIESADALISAALKNPVDPQSRGAAFEAGTQLCLRGACERASRASPLMVGPGDADVSAALAELLVAYARWSGERNKKNSVALEGALQAIAPEAPTLLTIMAFDQYYASLMQAGKIADIRKITELASAHYAPVRNLIPVNWARVELAATATAFADKRDDAVIDRLAKLEVELYPFTLGKREDVPGVRYLDYETMAWRLAVSSWFKTREQRERTALRVADTFVETETKKIDDAYYATREGPTSYCAIRILKAPELEYPASAAKAGYIGAVIAGFEINDTEIGNIRILASVPDNQFEDAVLEAMKSVRWEFNEFQPDPECSRSGQEAIYPFQFYFESPSDSRSRLSK